MWYLVLSRALGTQEGRDFHLQPHMDWLLEQHRGGRILVSGPTSDRGTGIYVVLASSLEEARQIAAQDPFHLHGDRALEVFEWNAQRAFRLDGLSIADLESMATGTQKTK